MHFELADVECFATTRALLEIHPKSPIETRHDDDDLFVQPSHIRLRLIPRGRNVGHLTAFVVDGTP